MSEWIEGQLSDLAYIVMGQSPKKEDVNTKGNGLPLLNGPTEFGSNHPFPVQFSEHCRKTASKDSLLFCVRGSTTGRMNWADKEYAIGRGLASIIHKKGKDYMPFLRGIIDFNLPQLLIEATGSTFPNVSKDQLNGLKLTIPPLPEQKAIAHILGRLDDKIELNRQMNQTLEAMAQALFKSWFVDFDPVIDNALKAGNQIPEALKAKAEKRKALLDLHSEGGTTEESPQYGAPLFYSNPALAALFPSSFEYNETLDKWIPEGWEVMSVDNALRVNPKVSISKGETRKFVDMKALPTSGYSVDEVIEKEYNGGAKFKNGDVLLARITPCLENGKTAVVDFLNEEEKGFGSTEFIILRGKGEIKTPFVACLARFDAFVNHCIQNMVGSSGRQRVQNSCFESYFLTLPDSSLLQKFNELSEPFFKKLTKNSSESRTLTQLRDTLLPQLISGKVRLPASMLSGD